MNRRTIRLFAAVIATCDARSAKSILEQVDLESQAEIRKEINAFVNLVDMKVWRKVIDRKVVGQLYEQLEMSDSGVVDLRGFKAAKTRQTDGVSPGTKSQQSLERIVANASLNEGAA